MGANSVSAPVCNLTPEESRGIIFVTIGVFLTISPVFFMPFITGKESILGPLYLVALGFLAAGIFVLQGIPREKAKDSCVAGKPTTKTGK